MGRNYNVLKISVGKLKGKEELKDLGTNGRTLLNTP